MSNRTILLYLEKVTCMSTSFCTLGNDHIYPGIECFHGIAHRTHHVGDNNTTWHGSKTEVQQAGLLGTCTTMYHLFPNCLLGMFHGIVTFEATRLTNMNKIEQAKSLKIPWQNPWTTLKLFSSDPPAWSLSTAHLGGTPTAQMNNLAFSATMMSMSSGKWPAVAVKYGIYPLVMTNIAMENHHF